MKNKILYIICVCLWFTASSLAQTKTVNGQLSLKEIFEPQADLSDGIICTVIGTGTVTITIRDKQYNTLIYEGYSKITTSTYQGTGNTYNKSTLGNAAVYYPDQWLSTDIKSAAYGLDRYKASQSAKPYTLFTNPIDVTVEIKEEGNARISSFKIPGIGLVNFEGGNLLFTSRHFCYDIKNSDHCTCRAWKKYKTPRLDKGSDILIAVHRGIWGFDLGKGNPENSTAAINETSTYTTVLETDVMITKDKRIMVSHDYNLSRLSNFSGDDRQYVYNKNWSEMSGLKLKYRNEDVSTYNYLLFEDLVDLLVKNQIVVNVDIKDIRARYDKNKQCDDTCDYTTATEEGRAKILATWKEIFKSCVEIAKKKDALQYIGFKVPYNWELISSIVGEEDASKVMYMPVIQPKRGASALQNAINFIDDWNEHAIDKVCGFETNFKQLSDPYLQEFSREGKDYQNLLHYVYEKTHLRPGTYPEEPCGPKGIVNRYAQWLAKNLSQDMRGDHFQVMSVPYSHIMVVTTDRPDIWLSINAIYND